MLIAISTACWNRSTPFWRQAHPTRPTTAATLPLRRRDKIRGNAPTKHLMLYDWLKAFHIIAVIAWMAGMLYLPRLFVYHCEADVGSIQSETFKVMERRLLKAIINPSMIL